MINEECPIRVLIADDHPVAREGLTAMVETCKDIKVVAQARNGQEACELFRKHRPDVTLMDLRMPTMTGMQAIERIREEFPEARILILTMFSGDDSIYQGLRAGALGYLLKDAPRQELVDAIFAAHVGRMCIAPELIAKLAERINRPELTQRETEVLRLMATGHSNLQIANMLGIADGTVKAHINAILRKLKVSHRAAAVTTAIQRGMVSPPSA